MGKKPQGNMTMPFTGRIVRRNEAKTVGQRLLDLPAMHASSAIQSQGRIVEQDDDGAIVEVTCGCGKVLHLHCRYAAPAG